MLKTLMTTTALTFALAVPSFAQEMEDTDMDTNMEETFEAAEAEDGMMEDEDGAMETADADTDMSEDMDGEDTMTADAEPVIPEDMDGEENMTVTAETLNGETDMENADGETMTAEADMSSEGLDQLSQFSGMTVDQIVGLNVLSADGEDVGEIDYVISDGEGYQAVIGIGGFLGLGEYTVAMPLENFAMTDGELILDEATEEELNNMPEIDESELEELDGDYVIS
ncbi:PRC-barrel domain-containing protein [Pseudooctadecabacter sp.]|uniref:PRC-barrel domain-containing protein n=1 Tax=Pseudooctadecabacter sp. TaxID=1966338 RepID=UPI0025E8C2E1|nr:PRC-barrel domain-containing protein [Pseudooctadecabacter sp.]